MYVTVGVGGVVVTLYAMWDRILTKQIAKMGDEVNLSIGNQKKDLFSALNEEAKKAAPRRLKVLFISNFNGNQFVDLGSLQVLEIGGGAGTNYEYFQEPVNLVVSEPNKLFAPYYEKTMQPYKDKLNIGDLVEVCNSKSFVSIQFISFKKAKAEDLSQFQDNSVDAVIETLVLCSVDDVDQSLKEIHRILRPGGSFYFLDHVRADPDRHPWRVSIQDFLTKVSSRFSLTVIMG